MTEVSQLTRKRSSRNNKLELPDTLVAQEAEELRQDEQYYNRLLLGTLALDKLKQQRPDEQVGFIQLSPRSPRNSGSGGHSALRQSRGNNSAVMNTK
jgi:hypothetical protein